jgi:hypothetical protein
MKAKLVITLLLIMLVTTSPASGKQVVLVLLSYVGIDDLMSANTPTIRQLAEDYTVGLMNNRTGGSLDLPCAYATIAAGTRMRAGANAELALEPDELQGGFTATQIWTSLWGSPPQGGVLLPYIESTVKQSTLLAYPVTPFALGQTIYDGGLQSAVVGNADTGRQKQRAHALITSNQRGITPLGAVQDVLMEDPVWPYGYRTDYYKLLTVSLDLLGQSDLLVVEPGDLPRLYSQRIFVSDERYGALVFDALQSLDWYIGKLHRQLPDNTLLVLASLVPREDNSLTPILLIGPEWRQGLVHSPTARRIGLIANYDITATILTHLDLPIPKEVMGRPIALKEELPEKMLYLSTIKDRTRTVNQSRAPIIKAFIVLVIITFSIYALLILTKNLTGYLEVILRYVLQFISAIPLGFLLLGYVHLTNTSSSLLFVFVTGSLCVLLASKVNRHPFGSFLTIYLVTIGVLWFEVLTGGSHFIYSPLGYDLLGGARFYGIGNEYMGVLVGTSLVGTSVMMERFKARVSRRVLLSITIVILVVTALLIATPSLGANTGGAITAAMGGVVLFFLLRYGTLTWKHLCYAVVATCLLLGFMGLVDLSLKDSGSSHFGRFAQSFLHGDFNVVTSTILRKLNTNIKLLRYTIWSQVLLVSLGVIGLLMFRPPAIFKTLTQENPYISAGIKAALISSLVTLLVNDSGVVSAATLLVPVTPTFLYLVGRQTQARN